MQLDNESFLDSVTFGFFFQSRDAVKNGLLFLFDELREYLKEWVVITTDAKSGEKIEQIFTVNLKNAAEVLLQDAEAKAYGSYNLQGMEYLLCLHAKQVTETSGVVLLEIPKAQIFKDDPQNVDFSILSATMMNEMEALAPYLQYTYAFCDSENTVRCTEAELEDEAFCPYSLLLYPTEAEVEIRLGATEVDGKTARTF